MRRRAGFARNAVALRPGRRNDNTVKGMDVLGTKTMALAGAMGALLMLAGCGGGGGDAGATPTSNATAFPLQAGYKALLANGLNVTFDVTGSCTGTASQVTQKPTADTFENAAALAIVSSETIDLPSCSANSITATSTDYFDASYAGLGSRDSNGGYGRYVSPAQFPATVKVGDSGSFGLELLYTDSSKTQSAGKALRGYRIDADTATTAIGTLTTQLYDASNVLVGTEQDRYRIAADGTLTLLSVDISYTTSPPLHLVLTPR